MIGRAEHVDASLLQPLLGGEQFVHAADLQCEVLGPDGGVGVAPHVGLRGQLEEGQDIALARIEKDVHIGIGLARGGHGVLGNAQHEFHAQMLFVPACGLQRVLAAVGSMMDLVDQHDESPVL